MVYELEKSGDGLPEREEFESRERAKKEAEMRTSRKTSGWEKQAGDTDVLIDYADGDEIIYKVRESPDWRDY
jgi:hypothetical protein